MMSEVASTLLQALPAARRCILTTAVRAMSAQAAHAATSHQPDPAKVAALRDSVKRFDPTVFKAMNVMLFKSCGTYAQKAGILDDAGVILAPKGRSCGVVTGDVIDNKYGDRLVKALGKASIRASKVLMGPQASWDEIYGVVEALKGKKCDFLIGFGGGKIMDVTRVSAHILGVPHVLVPTLASTDAPGTSSGVIYTPHGQFYEQFHLPDSASAVLVDTGIIAESPLRCTISGLGDGMSTYYEARAVRNSGAPTLCGGLPSKASWALAQACRDTLFEQSSTALVDLRKGKVTQAVEDVIEANTLLSGVGVNTCGLACAHALHNGLTSIPEVHDSKLHGEIVGWTTMVQVLLEGDNKEAEKIARWNKEVGLPLTFKDMHMDKVPRDAIAKAAKLACGPLESMKNMPFKVTPDMVLSAMDKANALGSSL